MVVCWGRGYDVISKQYLSVLPGGDEANLQLNLSLMLLVNLRPDQNFTEFFLTTQTPPTPLRSVLTSKMYR